MAGREHICVIAHDATYGNAAELAKALQCRLVLFSQDPKGMYKKYPYLNAIPEAEEYILVGAFVIRDLPKWFFKEKNVKIILVGTAYRRTPRLWNTFFKEHGWTVYAMPELAGLAKTTNIYYHPYDLSRFSGQKRDTLTVSHSPGTPLKFKDKDTLFISETVKKFLVNYDLIMGLSQEEAIGRRAQSHIFIDQLKYSYGKSSMEAMLTKTLVLSGPELGIEGQPPLVWVTRESLEEKLKYYLIHGEEREARIQQQYEWAVQNLSYEAVVKNLLNVV